MLFSVGNNYWAENMKWRSSWLVVKTSLETTSSMCGGSSQEDSHCNLGTHHPGTTATIRGHEGDTQPMPQPRTLLQNGRHGRNMETLHHCGGSSDWQISGGGSSPGHSLEHPPWFPRTHSEERSLWIPPANSPSHPGHWGSAHHRISTKTLRNRGKRFLNSIGNARFCTSEANSIWL